MRFSVLAKFARSLRLGLLLSAAISCTAGATEEDDIRNLFQRQVQAENAHDLAGFAAVLAPDTPEFSDSVVLVSRQGKFAGRDAVLRRFEGYFKGTWKLDPDWTQIAVARLGGDAYHLFAPTRITLGAPDKEPQTLLFLVNEVAVRTPQGWRFTTIVPLLAIQ